MGRKAVFGVKCTRLHVAFGHPKFELRGAGGAGGIDKMIEQKLGRAGAVALGRDVERPDMHAVTRQGEALPMHAREPDKASAIGNAMDVAGHQPIEDLGLRGLHRLGLGQKEGVGIQADPFEAEGRQGAQVFGGERPGLHAP